jgi:hypothetical protein
MNLAHAPVNENLRAGKWGKTCFSGPAFLLPALCVWLVLLGSLVPVQAEDRCAICGGAPGGTVYIVEDKVTHEKVEVCEKCEKNLTDCYICGLPANPDSPGFVRLEDGRVLCARDAKTAVLQEDEGVRVFQDVRNSLDRMFSRVTGYPDTNIIVAMVDRIHLQELFTLAGNDYHCPNILGYTQTVTNENAIEHRISLMTGLPRTWLEGVCAHELSHAWVAENVPPARRTGLAREAEEGFCELVAFLSSAARNEEDQKAMILSNAYTRGQVQLFIAAENTYGLNDVLDWMRYGTDARLSGSDPARIHAVKLPKQRPTVTATVPAFQAPAAVPAPTALTLKAVFWDQKRPLALINNRTLGVQEQGKVLLGSSNVMVRCLAITPNSVRIQVAGSDKEQELFLKTK